MYGRLRLITATKRTFSTYRFKLANSKFIRNSWETPARKYEPGLGQGVADRTYNRLLSDTKREEWADVANRVALGNSSLLQLSTKEKNSTMLNYEREYEFHQLNHHLRQGTILLAGRHLQQGDSKQIERNMEIFTNCATSPASFITFYLLLNGSGVGRSYDDDMILVDFHYMPIVVCTIDSAHADVRSGEIKGLLNLRAAQAKYADAPRAHTHLLQVPDSREGWAQAVERIEVMTYAKNMRNHVLFLDFSKVRPRGSPIRGMQDRPASGPGPFINALQNLATLRDEENKEPWLLAMYADHYLSECVLVGGARRAARMSTKYWKDKSVIDFIGVKKNGLLWSSNNSITVDQEFWSFVRTSGTLVRATEPNSTPPADTLDTALSQHARRVFEEATKHSYYDGTGEPGFINQDKLVQNNSGMSSMFAAKEPFVGSKKFQPTQEAHALLSEIANRFQKKKYYMITNPCSEIALTMLGGYCVIGDVVPFHSMHNTSDSADKQMRLKKTDNTKWDQDVEDAFRTTTRALIRVNLMDSLYKKEVLRTNRIGVGITGLHEYAWSRFGFTFKTLLDEQRSREFWYMLSRFKYAVQDEAKTYAQRLQLAIPHTDTTVKPSGTVSKLFGLTEGVHLPAMREYIRWVQLRNDDPLLAKYQEQGYPTRALVNYKGHTIVGFPVRPKICTLGIPDSQLITASEATPKEQYLWLSLLEKYWLTGVVWCSKRNRFVMNPVDTGNQVSYTLKYNPQLVSFQQFQAELLEGQSKIKCCSVMPQTETNATAYEYLPEEVVSTKKFERIVYQIEQKKQVHTQQIAEPVVIEHVEQCGGACPIEFGKVV